jgi:hypothetical protein
VQPEQRSSERVTGIALRTAYSSKWISGAWYDVAWYLLPCLCGYVALTLNLGLGISALTLWWAYVIFADGPHIFATILRTFLDREERARRLPMFLRSLLWFAPGPVVVVLALAGGTRAPLDAFFVFANLWAYWHVVRQHYGFLALYQRKNGEPAGRENRVDWWCFYVLMLAPFVSMMVRHPQSRAVLHLPAAAGWVETQLVYLANAGVVAAVLLYGAKELRRWLAGLPVNVPKNLFLLSCVPLHVLVFMHPELSTRVDLLLFAVLVTMYHNFQYHGIVWFYARNRYGADPAGERYGVASRIVRSFWTYYAAGLLFTLVLRYSLFWLAGHDVPLGTGETALSAWQLGAGVTFADAAVAAWWGFALNHYWLDQKIWRTSRDARLNRDLGIPARGGGAGAGAAAG